MNEATERIRDKMGRIYNKAYSSDVRGTVTSTIFNHLLKDISYLVGHVVTKKMLLNYEILNQRKGGDFKGAYDLVQEHVNAYYAYAHDFEIFCRFNPSKAGGGHQGLPSTVTDAAKAAAYVKGLVKLYPNQIKSWIIASIENYATKCCQEAVSGSGRFMKVAEVALDNDGHEMYVDGNPVVSRYTYRTRFSSIDAPVTSNGEDDSKSEWLGTYESTPPLSEPVLLFKKSLTIFEKEYLHNLIEERILRQTPTEEEAAQGMVVRNQRIAAALKDKAEFYLTIH